MRRSRLPLRRPVLPLAAAVILTLSACAPAVPALTPTPNVAAIATQAFQTYTAEEATEQATPTSAAAVPNTGATPLATVGVPNTGATAVIPGTGGATATPVTTSGGGQVCDSSLYISDVTIPDGTVVAPGQSLVKTWRIENTGSCVWAPEYKLAFVNGTFMGASSVALGTRVRPGKQLDVTVDLTAPLTAGSYTGVYQLQNARGQSFGSIFTIVITVSGSAVAPTATRASTATPAPTATP